MRTRTVGRQVIQFRNASRKTLVGAGQKSGAVFQALRYVGKDGVTDSVINKLARTLSDKDRDLLVKQSRDVPAYAGAAFNEKGGLRTFAASANQNGPPKESGRSGP
jgi:hypothetical protein